jgi:hypothetical protein
VAIIVDNGREPSAAADRPREARSFAVQRFVPREPAAELWRSAADASTLGLLVPDRSSPEIELLRAAYAAFNARDIDAALATMSPDVAWPKAFEGGFARGRQEVRACWTEQWSEIDPHVEPASFRPDGAGRILVDVHQVVRDMAGAVVADGHVGHHFTIESGLIRSMGVCPLPPPDRGA